MLLSISVFFVFLFYEILYVVLVIWFKNGVLFLVFYFVLDKKKKEEEEEVGESIGSKKIRFFNNCLVDFYGVLLVGVFYLVVWEIECCVCFFRIGYVVILNKIDILVIMKKG